MSWQTEVADFWAEEHLLFDAHGKYEYLLGASSGELYRWVRQYYHPYVNRTKVHEILTDEQHRLLSRLFTFMFESNEMNNAQREAAAKVLARISAIEGIDLRYRLSREDEIARENREREESHSRFNFFDRFDRIDPSSVRGGSGTQEVSRPARVANAMIQGAAHDELLMDVERSARLLRESGFRVDMSRLGSYIQHDAEYTYRMLDSLNDYGTRTGRISSSRPNIEPVRRHSTYIRLNGAEYPFEDVEITQTRRPHDMTIDVRMRIRGTDINLRCLIDECSIQNHRESFQDLILHSFNARIVSREPMEEEPRLQIRDLSPTQRVIEQRQQQGQQRMGFPAFEREYQRSRGR